MIKKIIFIFLTLLFSFGFVFAENSLQIELNKNEIDIDESFVLNIRINIDQNTQEPLTIEGIETFKKVGEKTSSKVSIINGEQTATTELFFSFVPTQTGSFDIGPAEIKVGDDIVTSQVATLIVTDINDIPEKSGGSGKKSRDEKKENNNGDDDIKDELNDIEKDVFSFSDLNYIFVIIFFLGLLFIYIFKKNFTRNTQEKNIVKPIVKISPEEQKKLLIKNVQKLKKVMEEKSRSDFYNILNNIFKDYFEYILGNDVSHLTYDEIKKLDIDSKVLKIYEKSYFLEFNNGREGLSTREKIIENFLDMINK